MLCIDSAAASSYEYCDPKMGLDYESSTQLSKLPDPKFELPELPDPVRLVNSRLQQASTDDITFSPGRTWLTPALQRIASIATLPANWDSYNADPPNRKAVQHSRIVLNALVNLDFKPASIDPSAEGGICISFSSDDRYGDIECFNSGKVLAVKSTPSTPAEVWDVGLDPIHIKSTVAKIRTFINR